MRFRFPQAQAVPAFDWSQRIIASGVPAVSERDGAVMFVSPANPSRLILFGGWGTPGGWGAGDEITTNEVFSSDDNGETWDVLLAHDDTPPTSGAGARPYRVHTPMHFRHGSYYYIVGGDYDLMRSDVWRTADGETWERVAETSAFGSRTLAMAQSYQGNIYVGGGMTNVNDPGTVIRDWWVSTDDGATFTELAEPAWTARACGSQNLIVHNGLLYILGGFVYGDEYFDGVWTWNGSTWTEVLPDGHDQWPNVGRGYHNCFTLYGRLFVLNGSADTVGHTRTAIVSDDDGETWEALDHNGGDTLWGEYVGGSHADAACIHQNRIIRLTGAASDREVCEIGRFASPGSLPTVSSVDPAEGPEAGGTEIEITGTNFVDVLGVRIGAYGYVAFVVDSPTQITVTTPTFAAAMDPAATGDPDVPLAVAVSVITRAGVAAGFGEFTYEAP